MLKILDVGAAFILGAAIGMVTFNPATILAGYAACVGLVIIEYFLQLRRFQYNFE